MQFHRWSHCRALILMGFLIMPVAEPGAAQAPSHMPEALRASIDKVVVIAGVSPTEQEIAGDYEKATLGVVGGMNAGAQMGSPSAQVGPVNVNFPFPILTVPGAIIGSIAGKTQREIQEFRDALVEDLARASNQPLTNDGVALDVYRELQTRTGLDTHLFAASTPIPEDTDVILYAAIKEVSIDVQESNAILTTLAELSVVRKSDEATLYERQIHYRDRDSLSNWTKDDNALWRDYGNFARHYLGRKISGEMFLGIELNQELKPAKSENVKLARRNEWLGETESAAPTLAWDFSLPGDERYAGLAEKIDASSVTFDVEVYDKHRLVYSQKQVAGTQHALGYALDDCQTYRWSVRPVYSVNSGIRLGAWMRYPSGDENHAATGITGEKASLAPAYTQDFAQLDVKCGSR